MTKSKVLVIGLDGATWNLIKPLAEQGKLPTFKKLMDEGVWGDLQSTLPPVTGPAWVSFATGKNPGKHGIFDFLLPNEKLDKAQTITSQNIRTKTFYEILDKKGIECILINLPGSFPPKIHNKIVITSLMTKGDDCVFPPTLLREIPELKDYRIVPDANLLLKGKNTEYIEDIIQVERKRFECAKKLFTKKDWDIFFVMFGGMDSCQHRVYDKLELFVHSKGGNFDDDVEIAIKLFEYLDEFVKWFIENVPQNANILFMSDHGAYSFKGKFYINTWLEENGYLKTGFNLKYEQPPIHRLANDLRTAQNLIQSKKWKIKVPSFLFNYIKSSDGTLLESISTMYRLLTKILPIEIQNKNPVKLPNVDESFAISISHSSRAIYINTKGRFVNGIVEAGTQYEEIRNSIMTKLKELKSPKTGEKVFKNVFKKEDIYCGDFLSMAPDIILVPDRYFISMGTHSGAIFNDKTIANDHALEGIFMAYGPDIKKGATIENAKIYDIAPTLLHIFGLPIPKDMDGKVLKEIFKEDSQLATREIEYQEVGDEKEKISKKIRGLRSLGKI